MLPLLTVIVGKGLTIIEPIAELVQPSALVPVTVKVFVNVGENIGPIEKV